MKENRFYEIMGAAMRAALMDEEFKSKEFDIDGNFINIERDADGYTIVSDDNGHIIVSYDEPVKASGVLPKALVEAAREARRTVRDRAAQKRSAERRKAGTVGQARSGYRPQLVDLSSFETEDDVLAAWRAAVSAKLLAEEEAARKQAEAEAAEDARIEKLRAQLAEAEARKAARQGA